MLSLSATSLTLPQTFINQQSQASFVIWNGGGGRLMGTVTVPAPFSVVSGGSFSLLPGQPQEVVVRFSSATPGSFSRSITISSNGGNQTVTASGVAHKISFSPAQVDFGSGLFVITKRYGYRCPPSMGPQSAPDSQPPPVNERRYCEEPTEEYSLWVEKVGLPVEKTLMVRNEGTTAVTLTFSTNAPYRIVSIPSTLAPGQSGQVILRFDPSESGNFNGNMQILIQDGQGSLTTPLIGTAHKIEIDPSALYFGLVLVGRSRVRPLTVKNQGVTTVTLSVNIESPFITEPSNSLTLTPGETREVLVRLSPTASGGYDSGLVLSPSGALTGAEIPLRGVSVTEEEYIQILMNVFNAIAQSGEYPILTAKVDELRQDIDLSGEWNVGEGYKRVTIAGLRQLDRPTIQNVINALLEAERNAIEDDPRLQRFIERLLAIDPHRMIQWVNLLREAYLQGRFDEEYNALLSQGLNALVAAFAEIADPSINVAQAIRDLLYHAIERGWQPPSFVTELQPSYGEILDSLRNFLYRLGYWGDFLTSVAELVADLISLCQHPVCIGLAGTLNAALWLRERGMECSTWRDCVNEFLSQAKAVLDKVAAHLDLSTANSMALAIRDLSKYYFRQGLTTQATEYWHSLFAFLHWMDIVDRSRLEHGAGTLLVAHGLVKTRWDHKGFISAPYGDGSQWWGTLSYYWTTQRDPITGRISLALDMVLVSGGDHCANCAAKANDIVKWVQKAIEVASQQPTCYGGQCVAPIISFGFTRQGATGIQAVLDQLEQIFRDSHVPIVISWIDANGIVRYTCIGMGCGALVWSGKARKIACNQLGLGSNCTAIYVPRGEWVIVEPPPPASNKGLAAAFTP